MRCLFNIKTFFAKIFVSKLDDYINKNLNSEFFVLFGKKGKNLMQLYTMIILLKHIAILEMNGRYFASRTT
jgi:hypothetical protein